MLSCLLDTTTSVHPVLAREWTAPISLTLSSVQHSITLWATQSLKGWSHTCWALANPVTPGLGRAALLALSAENALPDIWHHGDSSTWPLLCVHAQSPCACLLLAQQCQDVEVCFPCVGLAHLQAPALWLVMLCCRTDFSGGQRYLLPVKRSVKWELGFHWSSGWACLWRSSVLSSALGLHLADCVTKYFPQATSYHFCAWIKRQFLTLFNCGFLSICNILLFSLFLMFLQFC